MRWLEFLVNNPMDNDHLLTPIEVRTYTDSNNTSLREVLEVLPYSKWNDKYITRLAEAKVVGYDYAFAASKVRGVFLL